MSPSNNFYPDFMNHFLTLENTIANKSLVLNQNLSSKIPNADIPPIIIKNGVSSGLENLVNLKLKKPKNPIISYININSIRNKFELLSDLLIDQVDLLAIAETKLDDSFSDSQFVLNGFKKPYRLDITKNSGGLLFYIRSNLPSRQLKEFSISHSLQAIPIELTLKDSKWLIIIVYNPYTFLGPTFINLLSDLLDFYLKKYDNYLIIGDMNLEDSNVNLKNLLNDYNLVNLIRNKTCFKSTKGSCIDLILTNKKTCFQHSDSFETGLSDCHHLIYTMFKKCYSKQKPVKYSYRDYKFFNFDNFKQDLNSNFLNSNSNYCYSVFDSIFTGVLNMHAPLIVRAQASKKIGNEMDKLKLLLKLSNMSKHYKKIYWTSPFSFRTCSRTI